MPRRNVNTPQAKDQSVIRTSCEVNSFEGNSRALLVMSLLVSNNFDSAARGMHEFPARCLADSSVCLSLIARSLAIRPSYATI
jgi:hypothetical protein